ncbi:MAG: NAD-dependent epimerase/dehydratase family protein [Bacteroidales bacterium]|jgi:dihydroflavonol-4-reductase|nr:NAD-dependent epimerase/dehydratase family protein [Bacteroidales bacterium]
MKNSSNNTIYLVTGAAGHLGTNITLQLLTRGEKVRAFVLPGDPTSKYIPAEVEIYEGDLCNAQSVERFLTVPEGMQSVVIHCASMVTVNPDFNQKVMDINVGGTQNIINACLSRKETTKMVYVSSTGAIPELPKGQKIREIYNFEPDKVLGCYSQSKALATQAVLDAVKNFKLNACVVHPSGIMGPNDHGSSETTGVIIQIINGEMPAGIKGSFNLCDVRDLAYGCILAADKGVAGQCYILGNDIITLKEVCNLLAEETGSKKLPFYLPLSIAKFAAAIMERRAKKSGNRPLITTFSVYNLARNNEFDYIKAVRELGYRVRPYKETIRDEVAWLIADGRIKISKK